MAEVVDVQGSEDNEDNINFNMYEACGKGDLLTVSGLVKEVSDINWHNPNYENFTFLHTSANRGQLQVLNLLLDHGADLKVKAIGGTSILHAACYSDNVQVFELLVDKDPSLLLEKDNDGATVLHHACMFGSLDTVLYFLFKGLSLRDKDKDDQTCLHLACRTGNWTVIEYLLMNGLSLYDSDKDNTTPLDILNEDPRIHGPSCITNNKEYCLQQLKDRGTRFLNAEDLARIPDDKLSEIVTLRDALRFLREKSADWNEIGLELGLSQNYRKEVRNDLSITTDVARLEAVLGKWLESSPTPITWSGFIEILNNSLHYCAIARQVHTFATQQ